MSFVLWSVLTLTTLQGPAVEPPPERVREARALAQDGHYEDALKEFRALLAFAPKDPLLNYYVGITLFKLERFTAASVYLKRSIDLGAPFPEPYLWLARTRLELLDPKAARSVLEAALDKFPRHKELGELQQHLDSSESP